jgi:hypothetical protein
VPDRKRGGPTRDLPDLHEMGCPEHFTARAIGAAPGPCVCPPPRRWLPLYLRVGTGDEHLVAHITASPTELPGLLRAVAAEIERRADPSGRPAESENPVPDPQRRDEQPAQPEPTTDHQAEQTGSERAQQAAPRNRQAPPPGRNR